MLANAKKLLIELNSIPIHFSQLFQCPRPAIESEKLLFMCLCLCELLTTCIHTVINGYYAEDVVNLKDWHFVGIEYLSQS